MDITSYLLGKKASGGGGSGGLDWSAIGYESTPQSVVDNYNYSKTIYDNWNNVANLQGKFSSDTKLITMPLVDTSNATNMKTMFYYCSNLLDIPALNTGKVEDFANFCAYCTKTVDFPTIDTSKALTLMGMFNGCQNLTNVPEFNASSVSTNGFNNMFMNCTSLNDASLNNILKTCISATSYTGTKTLYTLGFRNTNYSATRIQALPSYQNFIDAGWTIGY